MWLIKFSLRKYGNGQVTAKQRMGGLGRWPTPGCTTATESFVIANPSSMVATLWYDTKPLSWMEWPWRASRIVLGKQLLVAHPWQVAEKSLSWNRQTEEQRPKAAVGDFHSSYFLASFCSIYLVVRLQLKSQCLRNCWAEIKFWLITTVLGEKCRKLFPLLEKGLRSTGGKQPNLHER